MRIFVPGGHLKAGMVAAASLLAKDDMMAGIMFRLASDHVEDIKTSGVPAERPAKARHHPSASCGGTSG